MIFVNRKYSKVLLITIGVISICVLVNLFFVKRVNFDFDENFNQNRDFSVVALKDSSDNRRLLYLIQEGIETTEQFEDFNRLRKSAIAGASGGRVVSEEEKKSGILRVPRLADFLIIFNYDKTGIWLFEVWDLRAESKAISIGEQPKLDLRKYLFIK